MIGFKRFMLAAAFLAGGLFAVTSCFPDDVHQDEPEVNEEDSRTYPGRPTTVTVGAKMGGDTFPETKSAVSIEDDHVYQVAVYFFDRASGKILLKDQDGVKVPFIYTASSNQFACEFPYPGEGNTISADIYTICNYGSLSLPTGKNVTEADLDALTYSISSIGQLTQMPMAGVTPKDLTSSTSSISLRVQKLYAIYYVEFDLSDVIAAHYSIDALYLTTHSVNNTVHWFRPEGGDTATSTTMLDYATETELRGMADGGSAYVYVLENMQGTIPGASSWRTVQKDLGAAVANCTYIDLGVKVKRGDSSWQNAYFQIYLGDGDMKSEFDIPRNYKKTLKVKIPADGINLDPDAPSFSWDDKSVVLYPGESEFVTFSYSNFTAGNPIHIQSDENEVTVSNITYNVGGSGTGSALITADDDMSNPVVAYIDGGDANGMTRDRLVTTVEIPVYSIEWTSDPPTLTPGQTKNLRFTYSYPYVGMDEVDVESLDDAVELVTFNTNTSYGPGIGYAWIKAADDVTGTHVVTLRASFETSNGHTDYDDIEVTVEGGDDITYEYSYILDPDEAEIWDDESQDFTPIQITYTRVNGVLQDGIESSPVSPSLFNWSSSNTNVATVSGSGRASGVSEGTTVITATLKSDSSYSASADLTVSEGSSWEYEYFIEPEDETIYVGDELDYEIVRLAYPIYHGVREDPVRGTVYNATWRSSANIVTFSGNTAIAIDEGTTTIRAYGIDSSNGVSFDEETGLTVINHDYDYEYEIIVSPDEWTLSEGESKDFTATYVTYKYIFDNGHRVGDPEVTSDDVTSMALWEVVQNGQYVTNNGSRYTWAGGPGTAYAKATFGGVSGEAEISTEAHVPVFGTEYDYSLEVSPDAASLEEDDGSVSFTATYTVYEYQTEDGVRVGQPTVTSSDVTDSAAWSVVSGGQYVSSEGNGIFTWVSGPGTATIKATYDGQDDTAVITTGGHNPVESFEDEFELVVSPSSATIAEGETASFTATYIKTMYRLLDGVRTGESTETETDVTSSADWTIVSGSSYVTNDGDGEFTWVSGSGSDSATIEAEYNDVSDTAEITTLAHVPVESFEDEFELVVSPSSATIAEGETASFTATYIKTTYRLLDGVRTGESTETETDVTSSATWTIVSGSSYVTNDGDGEYTWKNGLGSATIRATYNNSSDTATVNTEAHVPFVEHRYEYEIDPEDSEINVGGTEGYTIIEREYTIIDGVEQPGYESETLSNSLFSWSSSNNSVATVSNGNATGRDSGTVTITASATRHGENVSLEAILTVYHIFEFTGETSYDIHPGETINVPYSTTLARNDIESWEDGPIETRVESGYVAVTCQSSASSGDSGTAHGGNTDKGATDAVGFNVVQTESFEDEFELVVSPSSATIAEGETASFTATYIKTTYRLLDGVRTGESTETETDVTSSANWTIVSGSSYVTNDGDGEYTWKNGPGNSTIKATYGGKSDTAEIETLEYVEVTYNLTVHANSNTTVVVGESIPLTAILTEYHNGSVSSTTDVTSICNWEADAFEISVSEGVVTASERVVSSKVTATYNVGGTDYSDFVEVTFIGYEYIYLSHDLSYSSFTEKVGGTFSASINVPAEVNVEATLYGGNFLGGILGYLGGVIEYDDCYSGYVEVEVSGEPTSIAITSAYFVGGSSEFYDEEEAIIYVLSF